MSPEEVVRAELEAWSTLSVDQIMVHFAADAIWDDPSHGPIAGYENIRNAVEGFVARMSAADMEVLHLLAGGTLVMTERIDRVTFDGSQVAAAIAGVFEIRADKIVAWRDYFDTSGATHA